MSNVNDTIITNTTNTKYIIIGAFVLLLAVIAYFLFSKQKSGSNGKDSGGVVCKYGVDKNGNCNSAPTCFGNPPTFDCKDGQTLICDPILKNFRCRIDDCESDNNPFPYDFNCDPSKIKCDSNKKYYCDSDYCSNGGILYNSSGVCECPKLFIGDKCECDTSKCKGGSIDSNCDKCDTCCDATTSIDNKCQYYGDNCENNCDGNEVYDPVQKKCVCPSTSCFKIDENGKCIQLKTSQCCLNGSIQDGKCVCNNGWKGSNCDISICGENGQWDDIQKKCRCYTDDNGIPLAVGDNCEYSRERLCNGQGTPYVFNGIVTCKCDDGFSGEHCTCKDEDKPKEDLFKCKGVYSICKENSNGDGTYSGSWKIQNKDCRTIFSEYGGQDRWENSCTQQLFSNYKYPDYYAICTDNSGDNPPTFNISAKTCNATPTNDDLQECRNTDGCFIPFDKMDTSRSYTTSCMCDQTENGPVYSCKPNSINNVCGPTPDPNILCPNGGRVDCHNCGYPKFSYTCQGSTLPKECVIYNDNLTRHMLDNGKYWYNDQNSNTPIFPVVNADGCSFDTLSDRDQNYVPHWKSLDDNTSAGAGFVTGLNDPNNTKPVFYKYDDPKIISYNINADISSDGKSILIDNNNKYPFRGNSAGDGDVKLFFNDDENPYKNTAGCPRFRKPFDPNTDDNSSCAIGSDGREIGIFKQYCANSHLEIIDCDNNPFYRTNKGHCICPTYYSKFQKNNVHYKGRYCQYNDNDTCNGRGLVDENGVCACNSYDKGKHCEYNDNDTCKGRGIAKDDGTCSCTVNYLSNSDNLDKKYMGSNCQYDDNSTCKGQGEVDNNGNCKWNPSKVFPRCSEFVNPNDSYDNLKCKTTVNSDLFSTNCVKKGLTDTPPDEYGCPINKSSVIWSKYTGTACHTKDSDGIRCSNGAYPIRITSDNAKGSCQNNDESFLFDACRLDDISKVDSLKNIDFSGISNKTVTGVGLVACPRFSPQGVILVNSNNNPKETPDYIQDGVKGACWGNGNKGQIDYVSSTDWFNLPIGQGGIQKRL